MNISNPAFTKFLKGLRKSFTYSFSNPEMADEGLFMLKHKTQKFANEIGKQLNTLSKKRQIYLLEQLLVDFSECKDDIYVERASPKEKDSGYDYFKKFTDVRSRLRLRYDIIEQLEEDLLMIQSAVIESLPDEEEEAVDIDMGLVAQIATSTTFNLAHEIIRRRLSRLIGEEHALNWILDPYDRVRERMNIAQVKDQLEGVYSQSTSLIDQIERYRQLDKYKSLESRFDKEDIEETTAAQAPISWNVSPMYLVELLVELHRKGFINLPNQNQVAITKGICSLFKVSPATMKKYLSERLYKGEYTEVPGRANEFAYLKNLPNLKQRKFEGIKLIDQNGENRK